MWWHYSKIVLWLPRVGLGPSQDNQLRAEPQAFSGLVFLLMPGHKGYTHVLVRALRQQ